MPNNTAYHIKKYLPLFIVLAILGIGVLITTFLSLQRQDVRQQAATTPGSATIILNPSGGNLPANQTVNIELLANTQNQLTDGIQLTAKVKADPTPSSTPDNITFTPATIPGLTAVISRFNLDSAGAYNLQLLYVTSDPKIPYTSGGQDVLLGTISFNQQPDSTISITFDQPSSTITQNQTGADLLLPLNNQTYTFQTTTDSPNIPLTTPAIGGPNPNLNPNCTLPLSPPNFRAAANSANSINLTWEKTTYVNYYSLTYGPSPDNQPFGVTNLGFVSSFQVKNLQPNQTYHFTLKSHNDCGASQPVSALAVTSNQSSAPPTTPSPTPTTTTNTSTSSAANSAQPDPTPPSPTPATTQQPSPKPQATKTNQRNIILASTLILIVLFFIIKKLLKKPKLPPSPPLTPKADKTQPYPPTPTPPQPGLTSNPSPKDPTSTSPLQTSSLEQTLANIPDHPTHIAGATHNPPPPPTPKTNPNTPSHSNQPNRTPTRPTSY